MKIIIDKIIVTQLCTTAVSTLSVQNIGGPTTNICKIVGNKLNCRPTVTGNGPLRYYKCQEQ